jgi:hypothetical protein
MHLPARSALSKLALLLVAAVVATGCPAPDESAADRREEDRFIDLDNDGYFVNAVNEADVDCADGDPTINPGATEICDRQDNDCSGEIDDNAEGAYEWYPDNDEDGFGLRVEFPILSCAKPAGYSGNDNDCNDELPYVYPSAIERCNDLDDDCDLEVDEGFDPNATWFQDLDGDGFGGGEPVGNGCAQEPTWVASGSDCNDVRKGVNPEAPEICDGVDNDCDELADDEDADLVGALQFFGDQDGDGYGNVLDPQIACEQPVGYVENALDCDDFDRQRNPQTIWYLDNDRDGFGVADGRWTTRQCWQPLGHAMNTDDCDDNDPLVANSTEWHPDADRDGFGGTQLVGRGCLRVDGWTTDTSDCNDRDAAIYPNANEICDNGVDNDCDGLADDADEDTTGQTVWYRDFDDDGYGVAWDTEAACEQPNNHTSQVGDCNDLEAVLNPNTRWFADADRDGYGDLNRPFGAPQCEVVPGYMPNSRDCNDADYYQNNQTWWFRDDDRDGQGEGFAPAATGCQNDPSLSLESGDCDDNDPANVGGFCYGTPTGRVLLTVIVDSEPRGSAIRLTCVGQPTTEVTLNNLDADTTFTIEEDVPEGVQCRVSVDRPNNDTSGDGAPVVQVSVCGAAQPDVIGAVDADVIGNGFVVNACSGCTDPTADNFDPNAIVSLEVCFTRPNGPP